LPGPSQRVFFLHGFASSSRSTKAAYFGRKLAAHGAIDEGLALAIAMAYANTGVAPEERAEIEALAAAAGMEKAQLETLVVRTCAEIEA